MPTLKNKPPKRKGFSFTPNPVYRTSTWKRTRDSYIRFHPNFEVLEDGKTCGKPGYSVDHVIPIKLGGSLTDFDNLSCRRHQYKKSAQDGAKYRDEYKKLKRGGGGWVKSLEPFRVTTALVTKYPFGKI